MNRRIKVKIKIPHNDLKVIFCSATFLSFIKTNIISYYLLPNFAIKYMKM